ncbi:Rap1a/Tai family immunity protein [Pseudomonas sp. CH235]|uniref:Rap1a/Tai family immunity protein n=1 Tax=Pseudomonas sp. CH235 TaxID=1634006 RepID=UPI00106436F8|nr:Rap1a/Tai family immunity protein [Pseudomonas sp. CH235]TEA60224.1 hypothetical protein EIY71_18380 [Pseudomonas sp. CH235]
MGNYHVWYRLGGINRRAIGWMAFQIINPMRMTAVAVTVAMVSLLVSGQVYAKEEAGLLAQCNDVIQFMDHEELQPEATPSMGLCIGMVEGVLKTMRSMNSKLPKEFQTCFPNREIANDEAVRLVVNYIRQSELTDTDDATLAMFAIQEAYLCE